MINKKIISAVIAGMAATAVTTQAAITFDWNDGTMQGWRNTLISTYEVVGEMTYTDLSFAAVNHVGDPSPSGYDAQCLGEIPGANSVGGGLNTFHKSIMAESPSFTLNGSGDLTFKLNGRSGGDGNVPVDYQLPNPLRTFDSSWDGGATAVGLRRDDGTFVLTKMPTGDQTGFDSYSFTAAELSTFVDDDHTYTLALVDTLPGTGAWVALDDVSIPGTLSVPEPSTFALLSLGGLALMLRKRK